MHRRLIGLISALALLLVVFPLTTAAATPNIARISSTTYLDTSGSENESLCETAFSTINIGASYSGVGEALGGSGAGELEIFVTYGSFVVRGEVQVNGEPVTIVGGGTLNCFLPGYAMVQGDFAITGGSFEPGAVAALEPGEQVVGMFTGSITDGVHPRQGRVSLTFVEGETTPEPPV